VISFLLGSDPFRKLEAARLLGEAINFLLGSDPFRKLEAARLLGEVSQLPKRV